jgi:dihydrofolate reductase
MGRLIQWNMVSLDGYFEGAMSWEIDWFQPLFNDELQSFSIEQLRSADALLFGRVTYEGMAAYWPTHSDEVAHYMNKLPKVVFSSTLERAHWNNSRLVTGRIGPEVERLRKEGSGDLYVFGSGKLCAALLELFGRGMERMRMKMLEARPLSNGCVILRYEPQHRK